MFAGRVRASPIIIWHDKHEHDTINERAKNLNMNKNHLMNG